MNVDNVPKSCFQTPYDCAVPSLHPFRPFDSPRHFNLGRRLVPPKPLHARCPRISNVAERRPWDFPRPAGVLISQASLRIGYMAMWSCRWHHSRRRGSHRSDLGSQFLGCKCGDIGIVEGIGFDVRWIYFCSGLVWYVVSKRDTSRVESSKKATNSIPQ